MCSHPALVALAVAVSTLAAWPVAAQDGRRPSRALFGSGLGNFDQELTVSGSAGMGYDTNSRLNASEAGFVVPTVQGSQSGYSILSGGLAYNVRMGEFGLRMNGDSSRRYYFTSGQDALSTSGAGIGLSFTPSSRTSVNVSQTMTYQPFSLYSFFPQAEAPPPGETDAPAIDYYPEASAQSYLSYATSATVSWQVSRRGRVSADYTRTFSDMPLGRGNYLSQSASGRYTHDLSKGFGLRLGYGYSQATYEATPGDHSYHTIDSGVDYNRALSISRRTKLTFSTGGTVVSSDGDPQFMVVGHAGVSHEIARTWTLTAGYNRDVQYAAIYAGPVQYQSLSADLTGLFSRRVSFHSGVGATGGAFLASGDSSGYGFGNVYSSTGIGTALNRFLSLNVNYSLYRYSVDNATIFPEGLGQNNAMRQTLSVSIGAQAPLIQRGRRSNAPR